MGDGTKLSIDAASALFLGARERQEDALAMAFPQGPDAGFAVLSDGMGGHAAGDLASRIIVAEVFAELTLNQPQSADAKQDIPALLRHAVTQANETIGAHAAAAAGPATGMGGTVVATIFSSGRLHWISVGDSVLYMFRDMALIRLNADHSMAPQIDLMVKRGMLSPEDALRHPQRNMLTSALMGEEISEIDCPDTSVELREGDVVILASDGLQFLPDPIIEALLIRARNQDCRRIARDLLDAVGKLNDPEQDNVSVIVACVTACEKPEAFARGWLSRAGLLAPWRREGPPVPLNSAQRG